MDNSNGQFNGYDASRFTLFFPEPPSVRDLRNWHLSLAPQCMLMWDNSENVMPMFCERGHRRGGVTEGTRFVLRIPNDRITRQGYALHEEYMRKQEAAWTAGGSIAAVLIGNEWDMGWDLRWHNPQGVIPDWGNTQKPAYPPLISALGAGTLMQGAAGVIATLPGNRSTLVSAAYSMRGYTEDDAPDPGLFSWREVTGPACYGYGSSINGNGVHYYDTGWWVRDPILPRPPYAITQSDMELLAFARCATQANVFRFMQAVRFWSSFHHHPLYWDEVQTHNAGMLPWEHMEACVGKSKLLIHHRNPLGYQLGERVAMFCPFTSNGLGNDYPAEYIMTDPACYEVVRAHMIEEGYEDA